MSQLGLPAEICNMLTNVWFQQQRYMYLEQCMDPTCIVRRSLPQGDAFSMMAMIATLTPATVALRGQFPDVVHRTYCDDRAFCGPIATILQFKDQWCKWSEALGLKENPDKSVHWHSTAKGCKKLQEAFVLQEHPRLLGCEFTEENFTFAGILGPEKIIDFHQGAGFGCFWMVFSYHHHGQNKQITNYDFKNTARVSLCQP